MKRKLEIYFLILANVYPFTYFFLAFCMHSSFIVISSSKPSSKAIDDAPASRQEHSFAWWLMFLFNELSSEYEWPVRLILVEVFTSHGHEITIHSRNIAVTVIPGVYSSQLTRCYASWKVRWAHAPISFSFTASRNSFLQKCCAAALVRARELAPIDSFVRCGSPRLSVLLPAILLFC